MNVFLGLGSNLGNREKNLQDALAELHKLADGKLKISSFYDTAPVGYREQNRFLNAALGFNTKLSPKKLLTALQIIEKKLGREPTFKWGPRIIDIDILAYGDKIIDTETMHIPHLELPNRKFVLEPLCEIAPNTIDARSKKTYRQLLELLK